MSSSTSTSAKAAQGERIQANHKTIYGADRNIDLGIEIDDYEYYLCYL
jgi:hypothetical protein